MNRRLIVLIALGALVFIQRNAEAQRLEALLAVTPTVLQDDTYEAFSVDNTVALRFGADLRLKLATRGGFDILPLIGYRFAIDEGEPYGILETELLTHDFQAGLRIRRDLVSWLAVFVQASGGLLMANLAGRVQNNDAYLLDQSSDRSKYTDRGLTWEAEGSAGLEVRIFQACLNIPGFKRLGFGAELSGGYLRRGNLEFSPELQDQGELALPLVAGPSWGHINLSGWFVQAGASLKFL
ncbi:MAG: hypothetical protein QNJ97_09755 [Myxococcota bacterium]|nr:hypothetical protein [Myxococcota bacterium]